MYSLSSINQLSERIGSGEISPIELVDQCLKRIKSLDPILNSFITIQSEQKIYEQARKSEKEIKSGRYLGPLHGIPYCIKDMFYIKNIRFTGGSKIFSNYIPSFSSKIVKQMMKAGSILMGTNNLNEFASGITGENPFFGNSLNPWDLSRISGGSSGGSAIAVATGMSFLSIGTDTGGSVRVPSALCGVVGFKPTFNLISKADVFPLSPSLDHVGFITRSALDTVLMLNILAKSNPKYNRYNNPQVLLQEIEKKSIVLGIPKNYFLDNIDHDIHTLFNNFINTMSTLGMTQEDISLRFTWQYYDNWRKVRLAEASHIHRNLFASSKENYSKNLRNMFIEGLKLSATEYIEAFINTNKVRKEFLNILKNMADVVVVPTTTITSPKFGEEYINSYSSNERMSVRQALLKNTIVFNSIGLPCVTIPLGLTTNGLPAGVQIIGSPNQEYLILSIAYLYESINNTKTKLIPPICVRC
jgi:aspartyl-tRNA(Asn)/glutamyl-tRNA(Gln) amidotransferase subunit A